MMVVICEHVRGTVVFWLVPGIGLVVLISAEHAPVLIGVCRVRHNACDVR